MFDVEFVFGDQTAVGCARHCGEHGSKAGIATEDFQHHDAFMGTGRSPQCICHVDGPGYTGAETDAVISTWHIIVHCFGNGNNFESLLVQPYTVA